MSAPKIDVGQVQGWVMLVALGALAGFVVYAWRRGPGNAAADVMAGVVGGGTSAAIGAVDGAVSGVVKGIGDYLGIPDPATGESKEKCCVALGAGAMYEASKYCDAGTLASFTFTGKLPEFCGLPDFGNVHGGSSSATGGATGTW